MIAIGSDHGGFKLKEKLKKYFIKNKIKFEDLGNKELDPNDDYPDYAKKVAKKISKSKDVGILICGSSQGVCIVANKQKGIRAVSITNTRDARLSRLHNDANVLCLSGWNTSFIKAKSIVKVFLSTKFSNEVRHKRRIKKIE